MCGEFDGAVSGIGRGGEGVKMQNESYLFHYTNVSALAQILKNKTIKFSPLTVVDDLQEQDIQDRQKYGKYCFVSSWTDEENESIPMWKMYASMDSGARIKLPKYPFKEYVINDRNVPAYSERNNISGLSVFTNNVFTESPYCPLPTKLLCKVEYTDDPHKLKPQVITVKNGQTTVSTDIIGQCKSKYWKFQSEWRYVLFFLPFGYREMMRSARDDKNQSSLKKLALCPDLPFNYYFLEINDNDFAQMEVVLSPKMSEGNKCIVELLKKEYNSSMKMMPSKLTGLIG